MNTIFARIGVLCCLAWVPTESRAEAPPDDPSTTLWYTQPARSWQHEALPIGNGRLGAMIFGGVGHERIALNEETVWSGMRTEWNRPDAKKNLPRIRELLLEGLNAEAEALVNQSFTCVGGGSRGGANGPWGCYQELGNMRIVWGSDVPTLQLGHWKYTMLTTPGVTDIREHRRQIARKVDELSMPGADVSAWTDYVIADGDALEGHRRLKIGEKLVLRHVLTLDEAQLPDYGVLRIGAQPRNGRVFVNGQQVGEFAGWQDAGHGRFARDVSTHLKAGENVIAIYCSNYRRRGQMPLAVSLGPR